MANISTEDLSNKNLSRPLIRTMEDDLRLLKINPSLKAPSVSVQSDKSSQNLTVNPAPTLKQYGSALPKPQADQEKIEQLKREKETEMKKERDEELKKEREKIEQARKEKEKIELAKREKEMEIKKKIADEIKKEMEAEIEIEKEEAKRIKKEMEIKIKKELEAEVEKEKEFVFSSKKNLSFFSAAQPSEFKTDLKKSVKNQYLELSGGYEHLSPEMRLARQGFSSFSADLEEGIRKDAELMNQDLVLKKKTAASSASLASEQPKNISIKESLAKQNAPRELFSVFKTGLKIAVLLLLVAGVFYGIYYLVFRKAPADIIIPAASQSVLSGLRQIEISADFNFDAAPAIKEYIKNNAASAAGVSRIIIKDTASSNSLKINDFEKALGVVMPANFSDNLAGDYDLIVFNYPQNNYLRMGLALKVKNADLAAALAKEWEPAMFAGLSPLLFDPSGFYDNSKSFSENNYKNISIKYLPLGKNNLALNYAIDKNKNIFLFAASKEDIYYLIDEAEK